MESVYPNIFQKNLFNSHFQKNGWALISIKLKFIDETSAGWKVSKGPLKLGLIIITILQSYI